MSWSTLYMSYGRLRLGESKSNVLVAKGDTARSTGVARGNQGRRIHNKNAQNKEVGWRLNLPTLSY